MSSVEYFFEYVLNTKAIVKIFVLLNLFFLNKVIWLLINGEVLTKSQSTAICMSVMFIVLCFIYRYVVLEE